MKIKINSKSKLTLDDQELSDLYEITRKIKECNTKPGFVKHFKLTNSEAETCSNLLGMLSQVYNVTHDDTVGHGGGTSTNGLIHVES